MLQGSPGRVIAKGVFPIFVLILLAANGISKTYFIATNGKATNEGTKKSPWDIATVFDNKVAILAGDTIMMRDGVYKRNNKFAFAGEPEHPIVIRSYPGETAVLVGNMKIKKGSRFITFLDFELTGNYDSSLVRVSKLKGSFVKDINNSEGLTIGTDTLYGIKVINLLIHDVSGDGLSFWTRAINTEAYGNLIYNNGWDGPDRGHGHAIYSQNDTGLKTYCDNICFWNLGSCGIKIYAEKGKIKNCYVEGNIQINDAFFLLGGHTPFYNLKVIDNFMTEGTRLDLGYISKQENHNLELRGNHLYNSSVYGWGDLKMRNNKFFGYVRYEPKPGFNDSSYDIDSDTYYNATQIGWHGGNIGLQGMQQHGYEAHGAFYKSGPTENEIFVRANKYEKGRANIMVYNYACADKVSVDLSGVLEKGDHYEIRDVQHYRGDPAVSGVYRGKLIELPMNLTAVDTLIGDFTGNYHPKILERNHSPVTYGAFIVRKTNREE